MQHAEISTALKSQPMFLPFQILSNAARPFHTLEHDHLLASDHLLEYLHLLGYDHLLEYVQGGIKKEITANNGSQNKVYPK